MGVVIDTDAGKCPEEPKCFSERGSPKFSLRQVFGPRARSLLNPAMVDVRGVYSHLPMAQTAMTNFGEYFFLKMVI